MKSKLHLWICFAACLGALSWYAGRQFHIQHFGNSSQASMKLAWYDFGKKLRVKWHTGLPEELLVRSLKAYSPEGYVSEKEWDSWQEAKRWRIRGDIELAEICEQKAVDYRNGFKHSGRIAWIINHTPDPVHLQTYFFPIIIREAKDASGHWRPVEYHSIGFENYDFDQMILYPGEALPFHYEPFSGHYKTKIRFKILGVDRFYYSEPFTGYIDYDMFEEKEGPMSKFHYKLEEFRSFRPRTRSTCLGWVEDIYDN